MLKRHLHTPAHLLLDDRSYFITSAIYKKRRLLDDSLKQRLHLTIHDIMTEYSWKLEHWVILDNHYHIMALSHKGESLPSIMRRIHSISGTYIRNATGCDKPVWYNYWDYCPRNEHEYYTRLNYLLYNPIKHGYVDNLQHYPYSSFHRTIEDFGRNHLVQQFAHYPLKTFILSESEDDTF
jgi:putative transposase